MRKHIILSTVVWYSLLLLIINTTLPGQSDTHFTKELQRAYNRTLSLRILESKNILSNIIKSSGSDNILVYLIEDYNDFFTIFIREEYQLYTQKLKEKERRIQSIKKGRPDTPYYLYAQADIRLHWALLALRFGEYYRAFTEVNKAFKLLNRNIEKYPDFMPNYKDIGILHAAVGTIPDNYRVGVELLTSMEGTIDQGKKEIQKVLKYARYHDFPFEAETKVLYAFLLLHLENESENAWDLINTNGLSPESNPLHCFVVANIAMRTGHNDEALNLLKNRPESRAFLPMPFLDFMLGLTKLRRLDTDAAPYFKSFLNHFKGRHYIKEAYQKLAWAALINGDENAYGKYMKACLTHGDKSAGGDKNAYKEAIESTPPNSTLLKARLLFDGGYYQKAIQLLEEYDLTDFNRQKEALEYTYRKGRILHGLKRYDDAIRAYQQTVVNGRDASWYFACNAALKMGEIYELRHQYSLSQKAYLLCLSISPDEYKTGLHQQAKAGLNRIEKKL